MSEDGARPVSPSGKREEGRVCSICGSPEPFHVHDGDRRIDSYFTIGRGLTDFESAEIWKSRALRAQRALRDVQDERSNGATANSEYIDQRISWGLDS